MPAAVNATRSCTSLCPPAAPVVIPTLNAAAVQKVAVKKNFLTHSKVGKKEKKLQIKMLDYKKQNKKKVKM